MALTSRGEIPGPPVRNLTVSAVHLNTAVPRAAGLEGGDNFVQRALEHVRSLTGFAGMAAEFAADPRVLKTSSGGATVHLQQQFKSIPIFLGAEAVRFDHNGDVESATGNTVTIQSDLAVEPRLTAPQAVLAAAEHATQLGQSLTGESDEFGNALATPSVNLAAFRPEVIAAFTEFPAQPSVLAPGPFAHPIKANLTWFPTSKDPVLGWEIILTMPAGAGQYRVIVDANSGAILYSRQLVAMLTVRAPVFVAAGPPSQRQTLSLPRPWSDYTAFFDVGALAPGVPASPADWLDDTARDTTGNCVSAHLDDSGPTLAGHLDGGALVFTPAQPDGDDQKVLNLFYYNSYLHDLFYLLGFREEDGNFQVKGIGGTSGDPVDARAYSGAVWGTANMITPPDGSSPTMNMGLVTSTNLHTAFDASVVFHEYMHGVTNRLVGGPMNTHALESPQSKAMGEGWGDYIACTLTGKNIVGDWVAGMAQGIRTHPYDDNYPGTFGKIGTGIYTEMHRVGEIWCAALLAMNRNLNLRLGQPRGQRLGLQLVVDALKLSPANPNMLDMRDAILKALDQKRNGSPGISAGDYGLASAAVWAAFAKFGMGVGARSAGADYGNVVEDFTPGPAVPPGSGSVPAAGGGAVVTGGAGPAPGGGGGPLQAKDTLRVAIPDGDPAGIRRVLPIAGGGRIRRATVHVDIMHSYIGDLRVTLMPPGQPAITLYAQAYQQAPDLIADYTTDDKLGPLIGQSAQGDWVLLVADVSPGETGALRGWGITIDLDGGAQPSGFDAGSPGVALAGLAADAQRLIGELAVLQAKIQAALPH